ncbi:MAG: hypothetical protein IT305_07410 [Chloroflexi bacterium]|nr:hypothetical protein [Chloroflexota bacterium]
MHDGICRVRLDDAEQCNAVVCPQPMTARARPILVLVDDLFVRARIDAAATACGQDIEYPSSEDDFRARVGAVVPRIVLVGMAATRLPWSDLVRELKDDPATAAAYVLAFGPHKNLELRRRALEAGADRVIANSAFVTALPSLLATPDTPVPDDETER